MFSKSFCSPQLFTALFSTERVLTFSRHCGITARAPPCHSTPRTNRLHCFDSSQPAASQSRSSFARQRRPLQTLNPAFLTHLGEKLLPKIAQRESSSIRSCDGFVSLIHEFSPLFWNNIFPHAIVFFFYSSRLKSNTRYSTILAIQYKAI